MTVEFIGPLKSPNLVALEALQQAGDLPWKNRVRFATVLPFENFTMNGNTLNGGELTFLPDGGTPLPGDDILIKDELTEEMNGIYTMISQGVEFTSNLVLERRSDADTSTKMVEGTEVYVSEGNTLAGTKWVCISAGTLGTDPITFARTAGPAILTDFTAHEANTIPHGATSNTSGSLVARDGDGGFDVGYIKTIVGTEEALTNPLTVDQSQHFPEKEYVDGLPSKKAVVAGTVAALPAYTFSGTTLTATANGEFPWATFDDVTFAYPHAMNRFLVKDEVGANAKYNGLWGFEHLGAAYAIGDAGTPWILRRLPDAKSYRTMRVGSEVAVMEGNTLAGKTFRCTEAGSTNTDDIVFTELGANTAYLNAIQTFTASQTINTLVSSGATITGGSINSTPIGATTASTGAFSTLSSTGLASLNSLSLTTALPIASGGTGATTFLAAGLPTLSASNTFSGTTNTFTQKSVFNTPATSNPFGATTGMDIGGHLWLTGQVLATQGVLGHHSSDSGLPFLRTYRSRVGGTALLNGDEVGTWAFETMTTGGWVESGAIRSKLFANTGSNTARGSLDFYTTTDQDAAVLTVPPVRISYDGRLLVNASTDVGTEKLVVDGTVKAAALMGSATLFGLSNLPVVSRSLTLDNSAESINRAVYVIGRSADANGPGTFLWKQRGISDPAVNDILGTYGWVTSPGTVAAISCKLLALSGVNTTAEINFAIPNAEDGNNFTSLTKVRFTATGRGLFGAAAVAADTGEQLIVDGTVKATTFSGSGANLTNLPSSGTSFTGTLTDNTTLGSVDSTMNYTPASANGAVYKVCLKRGTTNTFMGEVRITNNDDGTLLNTDTNGISNGDCGVTFSVDLSGGSVRLLYTTTSTGSNVSISINRVLFNP